MKPDELEMQIARAVLAEEHVQEQQVTIDTLVAAAEQALHEMCHTVAPRDSFTDAVDALDAALALARKGGG